MQNQTLEQLVTQFCQSEPSCEYPQDDCEYGTNMYYRLYPIMQAMVGEISRLRQRVDELEELHSNDLLIQKIEKEILKLVKLARPFNMYIYDNVEYKDDYYSGVPHMSCKTELRNPDCFYYGLSTDGIDGVVSYCREEAVPLLKSFDPNMDSNLVVVKTKDGVFDYRQGKETVPNISDLAGAFLKAIEKHDAINSKKDQVHVQKVSMSRIENDEYGSIAYHVLHENRPENKYYNVKTRRWVKGGNPKFAYMTCKYFQIAVPSRDADSLETIMSKIISSGHFLAWCRTRVEKEAKV